MDTDTHCRTDTPMKRITSSWTAKRRTTQNTKRHRRNSETPRTGMKWMRAASTALVARLGGSHPVFRFLQGSQISSIGRAIIASRLHNRASITNNTSTLDQHLDRLRLKAATAVLLHQGFRKLGRVAINHRNAGIILPLVGASPPPSLHDPDHRSQSQTENHDHRLSRSTQADSVSVFETLSTGPCCPASRLRCGRI